MLAYNWTFVGPPLGCILAYSSLRKSSEVKCSATAFPGEEFDLLIILPNQHVVAMGKLAWLQIWSRTKKTTYPLFSEAMGERQCCVETC